MCTLNVYTVCDLVIHSILFVDYVTYFPQAKSSKNYPENILKCIFLTENFCHLYSNVYSNLAQSQDGGTHGYCMLLSETLHLCLPFVRKLIYHGRPVDQQTRPSLLQSWFAADKLLWCRPSWQDYMSWASWQIRKKLRVAHAPGMLGTFTSPLRVTDPFIHHGMCGHARAVMHAGIANPQFPAKVVAGKIFPALLVNAQPAILRIW